MRQLTLLLRLVPDLPESRVVDHPIPGIWPRRVVQDVAKGCIVVLLSMFKAFFLISEEEVKHLVSILGQV
jgi:hypothetical protein